ncbi:MAG TPA: twin-arginine translocase TatA/TatE family subunit [Desulfobacteraceae bacterium]|nr:twin-arginine translocase TatA/TatE family subunit [Desulfobacteraceae bacterium]
MFGLGMPEILLILAIALIVIGPKKLPELAKTLGKAMGEFKNAAQDFKRSIDIDSTVRDIKEPAESMKRDIEDAVKGTGKTPEHDDNSDDAQSKASESDKSGDDAQSRAPEDNHIGEGSRPSDQTRDRS